MIKSQSYVVFLLIATFDFYSSIAKAEAAFLSEKDLGFYSIVDIADTLERGAIKISGLLQTQKKGSKGEPATWQEKWIPISRKEAHEKVFPLIEKELRLLQNSGARELNIPRASASAIDKGTLASLQKKANTLFERSIEEGTEPLAVGSAKKQTGVLSYEVRYFQNKKEHGLSLIEGVASGRTLISDFVWSNKLPKSLLRFCQNLLVTPTSQEAAIAENFGFERRGKTLTTLPGNYVVRWRTPAGRKKHQHLPESIVAAVKLVCRELLAPSSPQGRLPAYAAYPIGQPARVAKIIANLLKL